MDLQKRIESFLQEWYPNSNLPLECTLIQRKAYRWSIHLIYQIFEGKVPFRKILVKLPNIHYIDNRQQDINFRPEDGGRLEYEALGFLYKNFSGENKKGITAIRPLAYYSEIDALVLEYLPGKNFLSVLQEAGALFGIFSDHNVAHKIAFDAGRLLAYIHQTSHKLLPQPQALDELWLGRNLDSKKDRLLALNPSQSVEKKILCTKDLIAKSLHKAHVGVINTKLHGDYYPENIVCSPDGSVFTIDTTLHQVGPVEHDIAKFLVGTEITKRNLLFGSIGLDKTLSISINQDFLEGYQSIGKYNHQALLTFQYMGLIQRWIEVLEVMARSTLSLGMGPFLNKTRITPSMLKSIESLQNKIEAEM